MAATAIGDDFETPFFASAPIGSSTTLGLEHPFVKWTLRRAAVACVVRGLQVLTLDRDAHTRVLASVRRFREGGCSPESGGAIPASGDLRRILVCKTEQRGDVLLALPALRALRAHYPAATLAVLAGPWAIEILHALPEVDEILVLEHPPLAMERGRMPSEGERRALLERLRERCFDLAVDLTGDPWTLRLLAEARIPLRVGPAATEESGSLHRSVATPPGMHRGDVMLAIAALTGAPRVPGAEHLVLPETAIREAEERVRNIGLRGPYVTLHPGGRSLKRWPIECFVELVERLIGESDDTALILAGPDEPEVPAAFAALPRDRVKLWPGGSFLTAGAVLAGARLHVGNDSGLAHLATAVRTPTIVLFGPTRVSRWEPRGAPVTSLSRDERCSYPCWPAMYGETCSHHRCLRGLSVDLVHRSVRERLAQASAA